MTKRTLISAPVAPAVGLGFVSGGELFQADGATRIGEGYSHCAAIAVSTAVPPEVTAHCTSTFRLPDGELHLSGMRKYKSIAAGFEDTAVAITGGTGAYTVARGEGEVKRSGSQDVGYRFVFTIAEQ
ncbi:allene oxide cyclase barrel-like domain-containing protein [Actinosynnema sp. CA-299493]